VEFAEPEFIDPALALDNSLFHGRLIKVCHVLTAVHDRTFIKTISYLQRLWQKGPIYQGSTEEEDGEGGEALTEAATGAVTEAEGDTVRTGAPVAGTSLCFMMHDGLMSRADCPPPYPNSGRGRGY
jgi:hypothetical protein